VGIINQRAQRRGIQHRNVWRAGLLRIRELVVEGRSGPAILEELQQNGPRHYRNHWTLKVIEEAIWRLRRGRPTHGVPSLPADPNSQHLRETAPAIMRLMEQRRTEGVGWSAIAEELNSLGHRPAKARIF